MTHPRKALFGAVALLFALACAGTSVAQADGQATTPVGDAVTTPPQDGSVEGDASPPVSEPHPHEELADPNPAPAEYLELVEHALAEYNAGHYAEARGLLARAHALYPNARTLRGLGMVEFELRHYALSVGYLEQALASKERPLDGALRSDVESLLARAHAYVGRIKLQVRPVTIAKPTLTINGIPTPFPNDGGILLDVGDHFISLKAPEYAEARRALSVFGGEVSTLNVELTPASQVVQREPLYRKWWLWTAVGLVVAGAATGLTVGLLKNRDEEPPIEGNYPPAEVVQVLKR